MARTGALSVSNVSSRSPSRVPFDRAALTESHHHVPHHLEVSILRAILDALITRIGKDVSLLTIHQRMRLSDITHMGDRTAQGMHQSAANIDAKIHLYAEVPLIGFLRVVHLWTEPAIGIIHRTRHGNQSGTDQGSLPQQQPLLRQQGIDLTDNRRRELLGFKQVTKVENRRHVQNGILDSIDAGERSHYRHVVQCFCHALIGQRKPLLHGVDSKHRRQRLRRTTVFGP